MSQLLFGSLADHLGRRPPLLCGLALSVIGSVGCALSAGVGALDGVEGGAGARSGQRERDTARGDSRSIRCDAYGARASLLGLITGLGPDPRAAAGRGDSADRRAGAWNSGCWRRSASACLSDRLPDLARVDSGGALRADRTEALAEPAHRPALPALRGIPANLIQSGAVRLHRGRAFVYIDHFQLTPQQFAWMFGCNAIGLMIVGRINAHIVPRYGPELIFRRAMLCTAALGVVLFVVAASGLGGFWVSRSRNGCSSRCSVSISPTASRWRWLTSAARPERPRRCSVRCSSCLRAWAARR